MAVSLTSLLYSNVQSTSAFKPNTMAGIAASERVVKGYQDILSISASASLAAQNANARQATNSISQAMSMLDTADAGMLQIHETLTTMFTMAARANSGATDPNTRSILNKQVQSMMADIDRIANNTSFGGTKLLDGSLAAKSTTALTPPATSAPTIPGVTTPAVPAPVEPATTTTPATPATPAPSAPVSSGSLGNRATGSLDFTSNITKGQDFWFGDAHFIEGKDFQRGDTLHESLDNMAAALNNTSVLSLSEASYARNGDSLQVTARAAGSLGNQFELSVWDGAKNYTITASKEEFTFTGTLQGGTDTGVHSNSIIGTGQVGDSLVVEQNQTVSKTTFNYENGSIVAGNSISIDSGNGRGAGTGFMDFKFVNGTPKNSKEIQIGSTIEESLQNAANVMSNYTGVDDFSVRQLDFKVNGKKLEISGQNFGRVRTRMEGDVDVSLYGQASFSSLAVGGGKNTGIDATNVTNNAFRGTIQGFSATATGANSVNASVTVGGEKYTAKIADTNSGSTNTVRFQSESGNGGFFDVQLAGGQGQGIASQADADTFANRLDKAFSGVTFNERTDRPGSSGSTSSSSTGTGTTTPTGTSTPATTSNGDPAPGNHSSDGKIFVDIHGNRYGATDFSQSGTRTGGVSFQVGTSSEDLVKLNLNKMDSASLFQGTKLDLTTQSGAQNAMQTIARALATVRVDRYDMNSVRQNLNYASSNIQSTYGGSLTDSMTEFATQAMADAQESLKSKTAAALKAQTNKLQPSMLKLLGG